MTGRLLSVNVGRPKQVSVRRGRPVMSAIGKAPVSGRVRVAGVNVDGDDQADRRVHGGPDKAVYAYACEDELWWAARLDARGPARDVRREPDRRGRRRERRGDRRALADRDVELQVCQPRLPCFKLGLRFGDPQMVKLFAQAGRPGAYLRILAEGELGAGDEVDITDRPSHGVTVAQVSRAIMLDEDGAGEAAAAPELPESLSRWMLERAA